jgi:hypothetical protein
MNDITKQTARIGHRFLSLLSIVLLGWVSAAPTPSDRVDMTRAMTDKTEVAKEYDSKKKPEKREGLPFGKTIVGRPGFVLSPYAPEKGPIDVRKFKTGDGVKDPFTGKTFLVPPVRTTGSRL